MLFDIIIAQTCANIEIFYCHTQLNVCELQCSTLNGATLWPVAHSTLYESGYFTKTNSYISESCSQFLRLLMESFFTNFDP